MMLRILLTVGLLLALPAEAANRWGSVASKCESATTVFYSRIHVPSGSWEAACQNTEFVTQAGAIVTFKPGSKDASRKNHECKGERCACRGSNCANLISMKCVHRGWDGMWGEVRMAGAHCATRNKPATWGEFTKESCATATQDKYFARLHDVKGDWTTSCRNTSAFLTPHLKLDYNTGANRWTCTGDACQLVDRQRNVSATCVDKKAEGMWLEALVENPGCPAHWGEFARTCPEIGKARYEARLWDVPDNESWEQACAETPADYLGIGIAAPIAPQYCRKDGVFGHAATGIWARLEVNDATCVKQSFSDLERSNHCLATLPDIQRIWTPRLQQLQSAQAPSMQRFVAASNRESNAAARSARTATAVTDLARQLWKRTANSEALVQQMAVEVMSNPTSTDLLQRYASNSTTAAGGQGSAPTALVYTVGGGIAAGAFFGVAAEFGVAARTDRAENARGYVTFGHSAGLQAGATAEGSVGLWVVENPLALAGDSWGCSAGASTGTGVSGGLTAWFDFENNYLGATLAAGGSVGVSPVEAVQSKVHTFVF